MGRGQVCALQSALEAQLRVLASTCSPLRAALSRSASPPCNNKGRFAALSRSASPPRSPRTQRGGAVQRAMDPTLRVCGGVARRGRMASPGACSGRRGYAQPAQAPNTALRGAARPSGPCPACGFSGACAHTCPARAAAEGLTAQRTDNMDRRRCPQAEAQRLRTSEQDDPGEPGAMRGSGREASAGRAHCRRCGRRRSSSGARQGLRAQPCGGRQQRVCRMVATPGGTDLSALAGAQISTSAAATTQSRVPCPALHSRTSPAWNTSGGHGSCVIPAAPVCGRGCQAWLGQPLCAAHDAAAGSAVGPARGDGCSRAGLAARCMQIGLMDA